MDNAFVYAQERSEHKDGIDIPDSSNYHIDCVLTLLEAILNNSDISREKRFVVSLYQYKVSELPTDSTIESIISFDSGIVSMLILEGFKNFPRAFSVRDGPVYDDLKICAQNYIKDLTRE